LQILLTPCCFAQPGHWFRRNLFVIITFLIAQTPPTR
jgi:hypothetical protein